MRTRELIPFLLLLSFLLSSCAETATQPLVFAPAPWQDGEVSEYDVLDSSGAVVGIASWIWRSTPEGWSQTYALTLGTRQDRAEVVVGPDLSPIRSQLTRPGATHQATYDVDSITIVTTADDGSGTSKELRRPDKAIDNSQSLQVQRALPFAEGYATQYTNVIPSTGSTALMQVRVAGAETVSTPGGTFDTWHAVLAAGQSRHDLWYAREAPHLLVKYHNRSAGSQFQLRRWQPSADAAWQGAEDAAPPPAVESARPPARLEPNWSLVATAFLVQYPLMLLFPFLVGWWIKRRYDVGWGIFGAGALTFIASQVVHLPLNWGLGLLGGGRGVALWPLPLMALVAGLSAGVCEEVARWLVLRFWLRRTRGWAPALQFGAGHGGIEAVIFGLLALFNLVAVLAVTLAGLTLPDVDLYWQTPWYLFVLAGLERVLAIVFHIFWAVLVMRAVTRKQPGYLVAAIAAHAAVDFWAVWAMATMGAVWTEVGLGVMALASLVLILRLRDDKPASAVPAALKENDQDRH